MVTDEIICYFQFIKENLFVKSFTSEVEANLIKDFLVFDPGKIYLFCLYRISLG